MEGKCAAEEQQGQGLRAGSRRPEGLRCGGQGRRGRGRRERGVEEGGGEGEGEDDPRVRGGLSIACGRQEEARTRAGSRAGGPAVVEGQRPDSASVLHEGQQDVTGNGPGMGVRAAPRVSAGAPARREGMRRVEVGKARARRAGRGQSRLPRCAHV